MIVSRVNYIIAKAVLGLQMQPNDNKTSGAPSGWFFELRNSGQVLAFEGDHYCLGGPEGAAIKGSPRYTESLYIAMYREAALHLISNRSTIIYKILNYILVNKAQIMPKSSKCDISKIHTEVAPQ